MKGQNYRKHRTQVVFMGTYFRGYEGVEAAPTGVNHQREAEDGTGYKAQLNEARHDRRLVVHHDVTAHLFVVECQVTKVTNLHELIARQMRCLKKN